MKNSYLNGIASIVRASRRRGASARRRVPRALDTAPDAVAAKRDVQLRSGPWRDAAGQDGDAAALFSRCAKIGKRSGESEAKEEIAFVPVRVEEPARSNSGPRCRFRHTGGHELEFGELPEVAWLAALFNALSGKSR